MPPFIRKRRGWDWFTPAEIQHLSPSEQRRLMAPGLLAAVKNPFDWLPLLSFIVLYIFGGRISEALFGVVSVVVQIVCFVWLVLMLKVLTFLVRRRVMRQALRAQMLAEGIRPSCCFDCTYYTEGFEGDECPNCGAALVAPKPTQTPEAT